MKFPSILNQVKLSFALNAILKMNQPSYVHDVVQILQKQFYIFRCSKLYFTMIAIYKKERHKRYLNELEKINIFSGIKQIDLKY